MVTDLHLYQKKIAMWLKFGVDERDRLIPIDEVRRGKTSLGCPYCGGLLTAKKGKIIAHHFAHTGETCRQTSGDRDLPTLPYYDKFDLHLSGEAYEVLLDLWERYEERGFNRPQKRGGELARSGCIRENEYRRYGKWEFTKLGKLAVGSLSLMLFNQLQEPKLAERLVQLENEVIEAKRNGNAPALADAIADLRIYRAQYKRVLEQTLYLLEVKADGKIFSKIGVTVREVSERIAEIRRDLSKHFDSIEIKPLVERAHRGNVEFYFKHRYKDYHYEIGNLTEYFDFGVEGRRIQFAESNRPVGDEIKSVLRDLRRMKKRTLSAIEEKLLTDDFQKVKRSLLVRAGMMDAENIGRPKDKPYQTLIKHPEVVKALERGLSLRKVAEETGVAVNTVRKVKAAMKM